MNNAKPRSLHQINVKSVASYALLPGVFSRLQRFVVHVSRLMFIFTQMFGAVGLIPKGHPCLRPENMGHYRFVDIVGLAASNVVYDKKHLPQTVMFFVVIVSIVLLIAIFGGMVLAVIGNVGEAHAQFFGTPTEYGYSTSATNSTDWALKFLSRVFGDVGLFPTGTQANPVGGNPWFTAILGGMLKYYSLAMLVVAAFMVLYLLVITFTESARTGRPFGTRFDSIWAPIRLALAIMLLIPVTDPGYNGAQMITFQSAIWGSNLASNVWYGGLNAFAAARSSNPSAKKNFFSASMTDPGYRFVRDMFLVNLCVEGILATAKTNNKIGGGEVFYKGVTSEYGDTITYNFGPKDAPDFCGQVTFLKSAASPGSSLKKPGDFCATPQQQCSGGIYWPEKTANSYYDIVRDFIPLGGGKPLMNGTASPQLLVNHNPFVDSGISRPWSGNIANNPYPGHIDLHFGDDILALTDPIMGNDNNRDANFTTMAKTAITSTQKPVDAKAIFGWIEKYQWHLGGVPGGAPFFVNKGFKPSLNDFESWMIASLTQDAKYGWTTAGVFYLRMSSAMSTISKVVNNPPRVTKLPYNFTKSMATVDQPGRGSFDFNSCGGSGWNFITTGSYKAFTEKQENCTKYRMALQMNTFLRGGNDWFQNTIRSDEVMWRKLGGPDFDRNLQIAEPETSTNLNAGIILSPILDRLQEMAKISSTDLNPLGSVITWGNNLMSGAIIAIEVSLFGLGYGVTALAQTIAGFLFLPGFVLAFWVPMIPFLYFTFAVIEWIMSILEAIIGMPLFCLSMITLEGEGLGAGMSGVKSLFEIVLRPSVIIMSLVASVILFTAGVSFFNDALRLYSEGSADAGSNNNIFTSVASGLGMIVMYMFGIYTLATSCFKIIDTIPNNFFRWLDPNVRGFGSLIQTGLEGMRGIQSAIVGGAFIAQIGGASRAYKDSEFKGIQRENANQQAKDRAKNPR